MDHLHTILDRAWTAYFRQAEAEIMLTTPANSACHEIYSTAPALEREHLKGFFLGDQIPHAYASEHGLSVSDLLQIIETAEGKLVTSLFGFAG